MKTKFLKFETGRNYQPDTAQTIYCHIETVDPLLWERELGLDGWSTVFFYDKSRSIVGIIETSDINAENILKQYDNGNYKDGYFSSFEMRQILNFFNI